MFSHEWLCDGGPRKPKTHIIQESGHGVNFCVSLSGTSQVGLPLCELISNGPTRNGAALGKHLLARLGIQQCACRVAPLLVSFGLEKNHCTSRRGWVLGRALGWTCNPNMDGNCTVTSATVSGTVQANMNLRWLDTSNMSCGDSAPPKRIQKITATDSVTSSEAKPILASHQEAADVVQAK